MLLLTLLMRLIVIKCSKNDMLRVHLSFLLHASSQGNIWLLVWNIKRHVKFSYFLLPTITKSHADLMLHRPKFLQLATHMTLQFIREKKDPSFIIFKQTRWGPLVMLLTLNRTSWEREREMELMLHDITWCTLLFQEL